MKLFLWLVALVLLFSAAMLIAGFGGAGAWIAVIAVGVGLVALTAYMRPSAAGKS